MFPASTKAGGMAFGFPDTCKVPAPPAPPIPTPFPNTAQLNQAQGTSLKVKILNQPVVTKASQVPMSSGDEAGVAGGMVSGMNMGPCTFKQGVTKVKIEGNDAINQLKPTGHNGTNANFPAGMVAAPSQTKVIIVG